MIGWIVGGYLVASLLGVAKGARPATMRRAVVLVIAAYAVLGVAVTLAAVHVRTR